MPGSRQGEPGLRQAAWGVQWAEGPHVAEGLACRPAPMWVKAGQLGGPRGEIPFLTFPTAGAGVGAGEGQGLSFRRLSPRLRDWGGDKMEQVTLEPRRPGVRGCTSEEGMGQLGMGQMDSQGIRAEGNLGTIRPTHLPHRCGNQNPGGRGPCPGSHSRQGLQAGPEPRQGLNPAPTPVGQRAVRECWAGLGCLCPGP